MPYASNRSSMCESAVSELDGEFFNKQEDF